MKAFRNIGGEVREIQVDIGLDGQPILPPDTTVNDRPEPLPGHYVTVVDNSWVQIEIPVYVKSFETLKAETLDKVVKYRSWLLEQPVDVDGVLFDGDKLARDRLTDALVIYSELGVLPPAWVTYANELHALTTIDDLKAIAAAVTTAFSTRFYECNDLRASVLAAADEAQLQAIKIPEAGNAKLV